MATPEFDITFAVIRYAMQCVQEGNSHALREIGFGPSESEAISHLTLDDLAILERRITGHVLKIALDRTLFWAALAEIKREATEREARLALLRLDAPAGLMNALYGIGTKEYTRLRQTHGVPNGVGRPPELDTDAAWSLSEILNRYKEPLSPTDWLAIVADSGLPLRAAWRKYSHWKSTRRCAATPDTAGQR